MSAQGMDQIAIEPETIGHALKDQLSNLQLLHHICNVKKGRQLREDEDGQILLLERSNKTYRKIGYGEQGLWGQIDRFIVARLADALARTDFNQKKAASRLGITYRSLHHLMRKYGLQKIHPPNSQDGWVITTKDGSVVWPTEDEPIDETV